MGERVSRTCRRWGLPRSFSDKRGQAPISAIASGRARAYQSHEVPFSAWSSSTGEQFVGDGFGDAFARFEPPEGSEEVSGHLPYEGT